MPDGRALLSVPDPPYNKTITGFSGLRVHVDRDKFVIGEVKNAPGFFDAAGIDSPGLTGAPAIGEYLPGGQRKANFIEDRTDALLRRPEAEHRPVS